MGFELIMLPPASAHLRDTGARIAEAVDSVTVTVCADREAALHRLGNGAAAAYGTLDAELLDAATGLRWLACPAAGPAPSYYFPELVDSPVVVTNMRGIYSDHIAAHIMAYVLAFARGLPELIAAQHRGEWIAAAQRPHTIHLPEAVALIVGTGGIGSAAAVHCKHFGMHVIGIDPRCPEPPPGVDELHRPEALDDHLGRADFVIVTAPQTPSTQGLFHLERLRRMKRSGVFINIGRGSTVSLEDLDAALRSGVIGGAALDVFEIEPLPPQHPLWNAPHVLLTPHTAALGPHLQERRLKLLIDNCRRFGAGEELRNVVDKANWF